MGTVIFVWLACAVLCAVVAQKKRLNVAKWLLIGVVFGFFGLLAVMVATPTGGAVWSAGGGDSGGDSGCGGGDSDSSGCGGGCGGGD